MVIEIHRINESVTTAPLASETNEGDEIARKILQDVSSLVDDNEMAHTAGGESTAIGSGETKAENKAESTSGSGGGAGAASGAVKKSSATFVYALPGEVLKTSLNRHQRGIMDSRIYQLLTKKEIILPQVNDSIFRNMALCSVHEVL